MRLGPRWKRLAAGFRRTPLHPQWLYREPRLWFPELNLLASTGTFLDIGAGDGWIRGRLPPTWRYVGFDHPMVGLGWYGARPDVCGDASALPFATRSFDAVALLEVVEHLDRFDLALSEADRVLRPGGILLCSIPFLYPVHDAPRDFQRLTVHGLRALAARSGWEIESERRLAPGFRSLAVQFGVGVSSLVIAGPEIGVLQRMLAICLLPAIVVVNLLAMLLSGLLPDVTVLAGGHVVAFRKPHTEQP